MLRAFFESTWGGRSAAPEVLRAASFDEFVWMKQVGFPGLRAEYAHCIREARAWGIDVPAEVAAQMLSLPRAVDNAAHPIAFARKSHLDLDDVDLPANTDAILVDRCKHVSGLRRLQDLSALVRLAVVDADTTERAPRESRSLDRLRIVHCTRRMSESLMQSFAASYTEVSCDHPLNCSAVRVDGERAEVYLSAPYLTGVSHLAELRCKTLWLSRVPADEVERVLGQVDSFTDDLRLVAASSAPATIRLLRAIPLSLGSLQLGNVELDEGLSLALAASSMRRLRLFECPAFPPSRFLAPKGLEDLEVPSFDEHRQEWIDYAVSSGLKVCFARNQSEPLPKALTLVEIHSGEAILLTTVPGIQYRSEVEFEDADLLHEVEISLAARIGALSLKAAMTVDGSSLILKAPRLETVRRLLDLSKAMRQKR